MPFIAGERGSEILVAVPSMAGEASSGREVARRAQWEGTEGVTSA
jgi:hypothetical protein